MECIDVCGRSTGAWGHSTVGPFSFFFSFPFFCFEMVVMVSFAPNTLDRGSCGYFGHGLQYIVLSVYFVHTICRVEYGVWSSEYGVQSRLSICGSCCRLKPGLRLRLRLRLTVGWGCGFYCYYYHASSVLRTAPYSTPYKTEGYCKNKNKQINKYKYQKSSDCIIITIQTLVVYTECSVQSKRVRGTESGVRIIYKQVE